GFAAVTAAAPNPAGSTGPVGDPCRGVSAGTGLKGSPTILSWAVAGAVAAGTEPNEPVRGAAECGVIGVAGRADAKTGDAGAGTAGPGSTGRVTGSGTLRVTGSSGGAGRSGTRLGAGNFAESAGGSGF